MEFVSTASSSLCVKYLSAIFLQQLFLLDVFGPNSKSGCVFPQIFKYLQYKVRFLTKIIQFDAKQ